MTTAVKEPSAVRREKAKTTAKAMSRAPSDSMRHGHLKPKPAKTLDVKAIRRSRATAPEDFKTSTLQIRVKDDIRKQATATLEKIGISLPEAVRVFLGRIVSEQASSFALEVPNAETAAALRESMSLSD